MSRWIVSFAVLALAGSALAEVDEEKRSKLAVMDLEAKGVEKDIAENLTDVVTVALTDLRIFKVISRADIRQMLALEGDKQIMGCSEDSSCMAEIGGALGVSYLVAGSVGKLGDAYLLNLTLSDVTSAKVIERVKRSIESDKKLLTETESGSRFLVRSLLRGQEGQLVLRVSESQSDILVDDQLVGVSPIGQQTLPGGPHRIEVRKKGFITWAKDVTVEPDEPAVLEASLIPSQEYIDDYNATAGTYRVLAYLAGGVGTALVGSYAAVHFTAGTGSGDVDKAFAVVEAGCPAAAGDCRVNATQELEDAYNTVDQANTVEYVGYALVAVGVVSLGAGLYLFFAGPEPGVYDAYTRTEAEGVSWDLRLMPTDGGGIGSFSLDF